MTAFCHFQRTHADVSPPPHTVAVYVAMHNFSSTSWPGYFLSLCMGPVQKGHVASSKEYPQIY